MSRGGLIAKNAAVLMMGQLVTWSFTMLFMVIVPRNVGPSEWGEYILAGAVISVAMTIAGLGLDTLLVKEIARDLLRAGEYIGAALTTQAILGIVFVAIVYGIMATFHYSAHTRTIILLTMAAALLAFLVTPLGAGLQAFERMQFLSLGDIVTKGLVSLAAIILVKFYSVGIIGILLVALIATALADVLYIISLSRIVRLRPRFDITLMRHLIIGGLPYWATGLFFTFYVWVDSIMLSFMAPTRVVGWYGAPTRLFGTLLFIPSILSTALLPALSHSFQHDRPTMERLVSRSFRLLTSLSLPMAAGTVLLATPLVYTLFGGLYAPSGPILMVLGLTLVPTYENILINQFLVAADRQVIWTRVMAATCVINPLINLLAISFFQRTYGNGALGAAWALFITECLMCIAGFWLLPRGLLSRPAILSQVARSAVATAIMCAVVWLLRDRFIVFPIAAGALTYGVVALPLGAISGEDVGVVMRLSGKLLRRIGLRYRLRSTAMEREYGLPLTALDLFIEDLRVWKRMGFLGPCTDDRLSAKDAMRLLWHFIPVRATLVLRLSNEAHRLGIPLLPGMLWRRNLRRYGLDVVPGIPIGPGLYIAHTCGTVVMARRIGSHCQLISAITIGMRNTHDFPTLEDDVVLGAGARVLGGITVGSGARIGANAVVLRDVPAYATAVGVPARILPTQVCPRAPTPATLDTEEPLSPPLLGATPIMTVLR